MGLLLDVFFEQVPGEEAEGELALAGADVEEVDGVDDLGFGDVDVDGAEVFGETVADEDAADVEEEPEFLVCYFEGNEVVRGVSWVEVTVLDARPLGEIIYNRFADGNIIVDKWDSFVIAVTAENRDASQAETGRSHNFAFTVGFDLDFFLLESNKFGVNSHMIAFDWRLNVFRQDTALFWLLVAFAY